jgi:hypothetical protein
MGLFTPKELASSDGMLTTVWGPAMWHFLHTMSFNYPVSPTADQKKHYGDFMRSLPNILPCKYCRENLAKTYLTFGPSDEKMRSRKTFSRYVYELHETVNKMLKKKSGLSFRDVSERYEHFRARCKPGPADPKGPEKGCTEPLHRDAKAKCVLSFVPQEDACPTFQVDDRCKFTRKSGLKMKKTNTTLKK